MLTHFKISATMNAEKAGTVQLVPSHYLCVFRVKEDWGQVEVRGDSWEGTKEKQRLADFVSQRHATSHRALQETKPNKFCSFRQLSTNDGSSRYCRKKLLLIIYNWQVNTCRIKQINARQHCFLNSYLHETVVANASQKGSCFILMKFV